MSDTWPGPETLLKVTREEMQELVGHWEMIHDTDLYASDDDEEDQ